jgi:flagellar hook-associated protein 1 FlgK
MSDLLNVGLSGLTAYRYALNAIGENVANAQTEGYSRRSVTLRPAEVMADAEPIYKESIIFNGVTAEGVTRAWDAFRASEARYAASAFGRGDVRQQWLSAVEGALDDGAAGIGSAMGSFFDAGTALASNPIDGLGRSTMLTALGDVANAFRTTSEALSRVSDGIAAAAQIDVDALNDALSALYDINGTLRAAPPGGTARASLEDERDKLIDFIAERVDTVATVGDHGTVTLKLSGASGADLLTGQGPSLVTMVRAGDGRISLQLSSNGTTAPLPATGGRLAGLADVASSTADRCAVLDVLAQDFVTAVNSWNASGTDLNGNPGGDLIEAPSGAASVNVLVTDGNLIAAESPASANGNLLALDTVRQTSGLEARWGRMVSANAQSLSSAKSEAQAATSWRDKAFASLDEVTGVDLDREAGELLRFQQAYNGAARIVQVARETLNEIFDLF